MTRPGIESRSSGPLANTMQIRLHDFSGSKIVIIERSVYLLLFLARSINVLVCVVVGSFPRQVCKVPR